MKTLSFEELKLGMQVAVVDTDLNLMPICHVEVPSETAMEQVKAKPALVIALRPEAIGKQVGLHFIDPLPKGVGHSCDGLTADGHGFWVRPEHLYTVEGWQQHYDASQAAVAARDKVKDLIDAFQKQAADVAKQG